MRKTVSFYKETIVHLLYTLSFMPIVAYLGQKYVLSNISFPLLLVEIVLF